MLQLSNPHASFRLRKSDCDIVLLSKLRYHRKKSDKQDHDQVQQQNILLTPCSSTVQAIVEKQAGSCELICTTSMDVLTGVKIEGCGRSTESSLQMAYKMQTSDRNQHWKNSYKIEAKRAAALRNRSFLHENQWVFLKWRTSVDQLLLRSVEKIPMLPSPLDPQKQWNFPNDELQR